MRTLKALALAFLTLASIPIAATAQSAPVSGPTTFTFNAAGQSNVWTCNKGQSSFSLIVPPGLTGTLTVTVSQTSSGTFVNPPWAYTPGVSTYSNTLTNSGALTVNLGSNGYVKVADTSYTSGSVTVSGTCSGAVAIVPPAVAGINAGTNIVVSAGPTPSVSVTAAPSFPGAITGNAAATPSPAPSGYNGPAVIAQATAAPTAQPGNTKISGTAYSTGVNVSGLSTSSVVCTDGSKNLTTVGCSGSALTNPPSIVQTAYARVNSSTSTATVTLGAAPSPGNSLLIAVTGKDGTVNYPSGFTTINADQPQSYEGTGAALRTVQSGDGTSYTVTFPSTNGPHNVVIFEIAGSGSVTLTDGVAAASTNTATGVNVTNSTPVSQALVYELIAQDSTQATAPTVTSGWTDVHDFGIGDGQNHVAALLQYNATLANAQYTGAPTVTWPSNTTYAAYLTIRLTNYATEKNISGTNGILSVTTANGSANVNLAHGDYCDTTNAQTCGGTKTFGGIIDSGLTASQTVCTDASKGLASCTKHIKLAIGLGFASGTVSTGTVYPYQPVVAYTNGQITGLRAACGTADNGTTVITLYKNAVSVGTLTLSTAQASSVTFGSAVPIAAGDILNVAVTTAGTGVSCGFIAEGQQDSY